MSMYNFMPVRTVLLSFLSSATRLIILVRIGYKLGKLLKKYEENIEDSRKCKNDNRKLVANYVSRGVPFTNTIRHSITQSP